MSFLKRRRTRPKQPGDQVDWECRVRTLRINHGEGSHPEQLRDSHRDAERDDVDDGHHTIASRPTVRRTARTPRGEMPCRRKSRNSHNAMIATADQNEVMLVAVHQCGEESGSTEAGR